MNTRAIIALVALMLVGCGAGAKVCAIVDLAQHTCNVIKYLGPDGKEHEVRVTREEASEFAAQMEAKRAAERAAASDGGVR